MSRPIASRKTRQSKFFGFSVAISKPNFASRESTRSASFRSKPFAATDCASATLADAPAKIAARGKDGLALLEAAARPAVRLAAAAPAQGGQAQTQALALGFAAGQGAPGLLVASGRLDAAGALVAGLQPGMSGAPVFDREGRLLGLARPFAAPRPVAGVAPAAPHGLIAAQEAMAFAGLPAGDPAPGGAAALARAHRAALAPLTCSR